VNITHQTSVRVASTRRDRRKERGASLVEYALLIALIAIVCVGAVTLLGTHTSNGISGAKDGIGGSTADGGSGGGDTTTTTTTVGAAPGLCYLDYMNGGWYHAIDNGPWTPGACP
jgi:pilus assembly protein Flp/PilA